MKKNIKNPYSGYRRWMKSAYCELCGYVPNHPSELDANHIIPQSEIRKMKKELKETGDVRLKDKIKKANRMISTLCPNCHRRVTLGEIIIVGYRQSTAGKLLEWYFAKNPEEKIYGPDLNKYI